MTSKERVIAAINHREPDRLPIDFGGTAVTGVHVSCVAALRDFYGLEKRLVKVHEPYQMLGFIEDDLAEAMGLDVEGFFRRKTMFGFATGNWKSWRTPQGLEVLVPGAFETTVDSEGYILIYPEGDRSAAPSGRMPKDGYFFDTIVRQEPISDDSLNVEDNLEEFAVLTDGEVREIADDVRAVGNSGRAVTATFGGTAFGDIALVPAPFLKHPKGIRDVSEWYLSTSARRDYVHAIFSRQCEVAIQNLAKIHAVVGDRIDVVFVCGTDFGTQTSSFCSEATFRNLYYPYYKQVNDWMHTHTNWKSFKHSCGAVRRFIPAMIEAGFDILNPVQCSATGMDAHELKREYGKDLVFWGGGIDTQKVLPFGSAEEVRRQVAERCRIFAQGGGFVFNTVHNIQACTPVENIVAMLDAVREFNGVPVSCLTS
jgi:uroporphyrinogen-III decarboxylase